MDELLDSIVINKPLMMFMLAGSIIFGFINPYQYGGGISTQVVFMAAFTVIYAVSESHINLRNYHLWVLAYWLLLTGSTLASPYVMIERDVFTFLIATIFFILVTAYDFEQKEIRLMLWTYIGTALIGSLSVIYNVYSQQTYSWGRYSATFFGVGKDPNYTVAFLVPAVMILLFSIRRDGKNFRKLICLIIITLGIIGTGSRAGFLALSFCYLYAFLYYLNSRGVPFLQKVVIVGVSVVVVLLLYQLAIFLMPDVVLERVFSSTGYSDPYRLRLWRVSLDVFQENPLIGVGLNGLNNILSRHNLSQSHNVFLDILTSTGFVGLIILTLFIFTFFKVKRQDFPYLFGVTVSFFLPLFFINGFNTPAFWTPLIILGMLIEFSKKSSVTFPAIL